MDLKIPSLDLRSLRDAYDSGEWTPKLLIEALDHLIEAAEPTHIWINRLDRKQLLEYAERVETRGRADQPLYGVPFAIKDNIDLAGMPTTAGCPEYAYTPERSAYVVQRLIDAGAIPIGKTNLDQFATGLVGVRSPYGFPRNAFHPDYIPGGSSSGSAVAVACNFAAFSLGTDTAGSGRIPAAFNNLVGHKPSRGLLSTSGVIPACRTLDCVSIFARNATDTQQIFNCAAGYDPSDPFARRDPYLAESEPIAGDFRFGVPQDAQLKFFGNKSARERFSEAVSRLEAIGGERIEIDFGPFIEAAQLLYGGPWLAERFVGIEDVLRDRPGILRPITREIIQGGGLPSAADCFKAQYRLTELKRTADMAWDVVNVIVTPTAGTVYTVKEVDAEPLKLNSNLGYYTNFMNLLDYSAVACPAGFLESGLPFGVTLFAPAFHDLNLLTLAGRLGADDPGKSSLTPVEGWTNIVVCGAHMRGLSLNHQLTACRGRFLTEAVTAPIYHLYALPPVEGLPPRPGLIRKDDGGGEIKVEVWALPTAHFGKFVGQIPSPLGIGKVKLAGGEEIAGFICEGFAAEAARNITEFGGWRKYVSSI